MTTWKNVSSSRMVSGRTLAASSRAGCGGPWNEYDRSEGWIMTSEWVVVSRYRTER